MGRREETAFGESLSEACEPSKSLVMVMEEKHSTEKVAESAMLDKSLSSLEEAKTSVAEAAVCLPSQVESSFAIKCSDKILVCLLETQEWKCKLNSNCFSSVPFTCFYLNWNKNLFIVFTHFSWKWEERRKDKAFFFQQA